MPHASGLSKARPGCLPHRPLSLQLAEMRERRILPILGNGDRVLNVRHRLRGNFAQQAIQHSDVLLSGRLNAIISVLLLRWRAFDATVAECRVQTFHTAIVVVQRGVQTLRISGFGAFFGLVQVLLVLLKLLLNLFKRQGGLIIACLLCNRSCRYKKQRTG